jgi:hypothetical protein
VRKKAHPPPAPGPFRAQAGPVPGGVQVTLVHAVGVRALCAL